jgi:hypothetical protein
MAAELFIPPSKALDANADPYAGAKWFFYETGTTTPQTVYTTAALNVAHSHPVVADSSGKFANIFFDPALVYRGVLTNSDLSVTLHDIDPINSAILANLGSSAGSGFIGFIRSTSGAVLASIQDIIRRSVYPTPQDFGAAVGGDAATNTTAFNAWINNLNSSAIATGYIPPGNYDISGNLDPFTRGVTIKGSGDSSIVRFTSATAEGFDFQSSCSTLERLSVKHINADGGTNHTAGWLVKMSHPTDLNRGSSVVSCLFSGSFKQLAIDSCTGLAVDKCRFFDPKSTATCYSIYLENTTSPDTGDNFFTNNIFACNGDAFSTGRIGIEHISSGGLYLTGNKFLYYDYHYRLALGAGILTSIFNASNNSSEHAVIASLAFTSAFADNGFEVVTIGNNHFGSNEIDVLFDTNAANPDWITAISISGNGSTKANVCMRFNSGANISVKQNLITGLAGTTGIETAAAVDDVRLGGNKISGFTNAYIIASTSTYIERYPIVVTGTATLNLGGWGASGLFYGTSSITLPDAFPGGINNANIRVEITGGGGAGAGVAGFVNTISTETTFSIVVVGATTGNTVPYRVVAEGY